MHDSPESMVGHNPLSDTVVMHESPDQANEPRTMFGAGVRQRRTLMAVVIGGGALAVVGMRLLLGGPLAAHADAALDSAIAQCLDVDADAAASPMTQTTALADRLRSDVVLVQVPATRLHCNPFLLPGAFATSASEGHCPHAASGRSLQHRIEAMSVSTVLRGVNTVAMVDGVAVVLGESMHLDDGGTMTLLAVGESAVEIELRDGDTGAAVTGIIAIGGP